MATEVAVPLAFPMRNSRRIQRGSRYSPVVDANTLSSPVPSLYSLESAFQLQEYISQLVRRDPEDLEAIVKLPHPDNVGTSAQDQPEVDQSCWVYEHLRRLAQDLTYPLITLLQVECTRQSCPEMKAGEWLYLCVAHGNGGAMEQCCAIDYILHTLDSATALLNSSRNFPSRIAIPNTSTRHFSSLARRLSRIFAHAYFHHREIFEQAEAENALYERFLLLVQEFQLVPPEFLVIPWERPLRKSRAQQQQEHGGSLGDAPSGEEEYGRVIPRTILGRSGADELTPAEREALMASPSGGLGRRRTDTMYLTPDALAALDPVLAAQGEEGIPDEEYLSSLEAAHPEIDAPVPVEHIDVEPEETTEMVEAVDPFEDDAAVVKEEEIESSIPTEDVEVAGDAETAPDVEDVVPATESAESLPTTEELDKEAEEASLQGQNKEDVIDEPPPTPADEAVPEGPKPDTVAVEVEVTEEVKQEEE